MITEHPERFVVSETHKGKDTDVSAGRGASWSGCGDRTVQRGSKKSRKSHAVIYCEKKSHKGMIIGKGGRKLKGIGKECPGRNRGVAGDQGLIWNCG